MRIEVAVCLTLAALSATTTGVTADESATIVETLPAEPLGNTGLLVNGRIHPHGQYTTYHFEYGPTADYGSRTEPRPLPPRLAAYLAENWDENAGGWFSWGQGGMQHHPTGGAAGGFIRFEEPSRDDHNHDDGTGTVHLAKYVYTGPWGPFSGKPSTYIGAGSPDLRDARVRIQVRGSDWVPNGTELMWWAQAQSNIEVLNNPGWEHSNWAYTGFSLADRLTSGAWESVEYRLNNNGPDWSYAGDNPAKRGVYTYWPLDEMLGHMNLDCFHMVMFVDPANPPTGAIDFDEFELAYRNHSLLLESNGGRLTPAPDSVNSAVTLTDGWRHGLGRAWRSGENPVGPQEFVYAFADPVTIHAVQLHQNPEWPAKNVEVLTSTDGDAFTPLVARELPEQGMPNANFAYTIDEGLSVPARFLKLRIISGYRDQHWGLGEIEVFGDGARMLPDDDWHHVNADLTGLTPGTLCHYRLVAQGDTGAVHGDDRTMRLPADLKPHVVATEAGRITANAAQLRGRLNPLGAATQFYFEYGPDKRYGQRTPDAYGGLQVTPRLAFANVTGLRPGTEYHYRLVARNEHGETMSDDAVFETVIDEQP